MSTTEGKVYQADKLAKLMGIVKINAVVTVCQEFKPLAEANGTLIHNYDAPQVTDNIDSVDLHINGEYIGYSERKNPDEILLACYELYETAGFDNDEFLRLAENFKFPVGD